MLLCSCIQKYAGTCGRYVNHHHTKPVSFTTRSVRSLIRGTMLDTGEKPSRFALLDLVAYSYSRHSYNEM